MVKDWLTRFASLVSPEYRDYVEDRRRQQLREKVTCVLKKLRSMESSISVCPYCGSALMRILGDEICTSCGAVFYEDAPSNIRNLLSEGL